MRIRYLSRATPCGSFGRRIGRRRRHSCTKVLHHAEFNCVTSGNCKIWINSATSRTGGSDAAGLTRISSILEQSDRVTRACSDAGAEGECCRSEFGYSD